MKTINDKKYWRVRKIDQRFTIHKKLGMTISFELLSASCFSEWLVNAENYLTNSLGDNAYLTMSGNVWRQGRWMQEHEEIFLRKQKMSVYRISMRDTKIFNMLLLAAGEPYHNRDSEWMLQYADTF